MNFFMQHSTQFVFLLVCFCIGACDSSNQKNAKHKQQNLNPPDTIAERSSMPVSNQDLNGIRVNQPQNGQKVESPVLIKGEARGTWFFEASFPVWLQDGSGNKLAKGYVQAKENWMTEDYVPFEGKLSFGAVQANEGILILEKANPSGIEEQNESISINLKL
jgi:hypothetical protein